MKYLNKFWLGAIAVLVLASCADDSLLDYKVDKPESLVKLEYLKDYDVLKSYVNRSTDPNFKLGAGVSVGDFNKLGLSYSHIVSNFDEMTAGWEMKHGAIVQDDGSLNTSRVETFIANAQSAGISIYGHTLCWHANQNATYLNSTIAPIVIPGTGGPAWESLTKIDFESDDASKYQGNNNALMSFTANGDGANGTGRALKVTNSQVRANDWESQLFIKFSPATEVGQKFRLTMDVRADVAATIATQAQVVPYQYKHWNFFGAINATTEWKTISVEITVDDNTSGCTAIAFNLGNTATNYYFDNINVEWENPEGGGGPTWDVVSANNFETDNASNYQGNSGAEMSFTAAGGGAAGNGRALKITNAQVRVNDWDSQFFFTFPGPTEVGQRYILEMDIRADAPATFPTQAHTTPGGYKHWDFFGQISATTQWAHFSKEVTIADNTSGCSTIAFNLGATATNYYFDNIKLTWYNEEGGGNIIEMTPEEKRDTITSEMERWIAGIMEVSKDYVKAWDVVNEPMNDGSPYDLKSGIGKTDMAADEFYWQDYLGKDYAVMAFNLAAQYGNSDDKLFINDYNLEYNLDKCKGLIAYAEYIESKGARVDGIGTQMHINVSSDKEKISQMFELLAATGKLIKISELDIGIDGKKASEATDEDYQTQAEMYKYVVQKYFELIPAAQRYGITAWSPLDSPDESSWRAGEPIGLWTLGYSRKPAYGGFADGLSGK